MPALRIVTPAIMEISLHGVPLPRKLILGRSQKKIYYRSTFHMGWVSSMASAWAAVGATLGFFMLQLATTGIPRPWVVNDDCV